MNNKQIVETTYLSLVNFRDNYDETSGEKFDSEVWLDVEELIGYLGQYLDN